MIATFDSILLFLLAYIAGVVLILISRKQQAWGWIVAYWAVLLTRNILLAAGVL